MLMSIKYDKLFALLKEKGWSTYRIRKENLIGQGTLTAIRKGTGGLSHETINKLCKLLNCQPGDIMEYVGEGGHDD
jgi:putative transcriptional regulator